MLLLTMQRWTAFKHHCLWLKLLLLLLCVCVCVCVCVRQGGNGQQFNTLMRLHNRQNASDRVMQTANREITMVCDRMHMTDTVRNSALEIYKEVSHCCSSPGGPHV
jgi:hypothetical protein